MSARSSQPALVRSLGLAAAASIAISNMIGQGVFLKARAMTCSVGTPQLMLAAWAVAGLLALCGALTLAELGAAIPESGGIYAFLRRAYGGGAAFAYGWMSMLVGGPASMAALAVGGAIFVNIFTGRALDAFGFAGMLGGVHVGISGVQLTALILLGVVTAVNVAPAVLNGNLATGSAAFKLGMLAVVAVAAFAFRHGDPAHFAQTGAAGACAGVAASIRGGLPGFAAALIGALYAYQGWHSLTLIAGEVKRPGRTLPIALIASVVLVIALYLAANASFVYVLGPAAIADLPASASVGITVVETLFGPAWRASAAAFLFASVLATLHVTILTAARITYAYAGDTLRWPLLARVSARGRVPVNAVVAESGVAACLVLAGSFDTLSDYLVFNVWVFFVAAGAGVFVLRRREPHLARPYRTFGYPVVPGLYVLVGTWLLVQTAISSPGASGIGLAIVAASFPVYRWRDGARRRSERAAAS